MCIGYIVVFEITTVTLVGIPIDRWHDRFSHTGRHFRPRHDCALLISRSQPPPLNDAPQSNIENIIITSVVSSFVSFFACYSQPPLIEFLVESRNVLTIFNLFHLQYYSCCNCPPNANL